MGGHLRVSNSFSQQPDRSDTFERSLTSQQFLFQADRQVRYSWAVIYQPAVPFPSRQASQILMGGHLLVRSSFSYQTGRSDTHGRSPTSQQFLFQADRQVRYSWAVTYQSAVPFPSRQAGQILMGGHLLVSSSFSSRQVQVRYSCVVTYQSEVPFLAARQVRYSQAVPFQSEVPFLADRQVRYSWAVPYQSAAPFSSRQTGQILIGGHLDSSSFSSRKAGQIVMGGHLLVSSSCSQQIDRSYTHGRSPTSQQFLFLADRQVRYLWVVTYQSAVPFLADRCRSDTHGRSTASLPAVPFSSRQTGQILMAVTQQSAVPLSSRQLADLKVRCSWTVNG